MIRPAASDNAPLVSVIIPTFNRATMVGQAVESVLAQTFSDFELIVVDDGSTDETEKVLSGYLDQILYLQQPNRGVSAARNRGIRRARGQLIAFLDSDDLWLPEKLFRQTRFFHHRPEALICQTEEIWIRNGRRVNPKKRHQKLSGDIFVPSLELCLVSPSAVMLRRLLFDEIGFFDEALPACEDYDLWLRISSRHPVHLIDTPLIIKQGGHDDQLSRAPGLDRHRVAALKKIIDTGSLNEFQIKKAVDMLQAKCAVYAAGCRKRGKRSEAKIFEQLAEDYRPRAIYPHMPP